MSIFKKIFLAILGFVDLVLLGKTIGYIIIGMQTPSSVSGREIQFMGAYILAISYFLAVIAVTLIFVLCLVIWKKKSNKKADANQEIEQENK